MLKVLVTDNLSSHGIKFLEEHADIKVDVKPPLPVDVLKKEINNYQAIIVRSATKLNADILQHADKLELIIRAGIGVDNIDVPAATKKGILVANTPHSNSTTTAEHTFALITSLVRNIAAANQSLRENKWDKKQYVGTELRGKTLGLIGLGNIASIVAKIAQGYMMKVISYDPFISADHAKNLGVEKVELDELLKNADIVSIHCPLVDKTRNIINAESLSKMKPSAFLINCARGGLVDESALYAALKNNKLHGAAMDVFVKEPPGDNPLLTLSNFIATPHLGASTTEAQEMVSIDACSLLIEYAERKFVSTALNAPIKLKDMSPTKQTFIKLAEKIGLIQGQFLQGAPKRIETQCYGEQATEIHEFLGLHVAKALLQQVLSAARINYVNVKHHAESRDIELVNAQIEVANDKLTKTFNNLIRVKVISENSKGQSSETIISGVVLGDDYYHIVQINHYHIDFTPTGNALMIYNEDKPGVIGQVGTLLAKHNVNISNMHLSLSKDSNSTLALAVYMVDSVVSQQVIKELQQLENVNSCQQVDMQ